MSYVEKPSDHAFTAFLAAVTPSKALRDRERTFSKSERKRQRFLREKARLERAVQVLREERFSPDHHAEALAEALAEAISDHTPRRRSA